ncbi:MAG: tyrosine-type recombinase/integrase family protein [Clostridiales bacterium]|nr:tyrosine-type recombinase/integrase family protein [Clostridiales bacterium]
MSESLKQEAFEEETTEEIDTLEAWVQVWLKDVLPNVVKGTTIRMYAETMERHILPWLGNSRIRELTQKEVQDWVKRLEKEQVRKTMNGHMTEGTLRNTLSVLSGCLRDAQKYGLIGHNPCVETAWMIRPRNLWEEREWLSEKDIRRLEPAMASYEDEQGYPLGLGFQLVLYAGIALSEAAALRWRDVDFAGRRLMLRDFVARQPALSGGEPRYGLEPLTGRKKRDVPVPDFLLKTMKQIKERYRTADEDFVLCGANREPVNLDRMRAALRRRSISSGVGNVTVRMLRDTYAMRAVQAGASSDDIAELMGFASSQQVVRRYMPKGRQNRDELLKRMYG